MLRAIPLFALLLAAGVLGATGVSHAQDRPTLTLLDAEIESLYKQTASSLVRVNVTQSAAAVLDSRPGLKAAFDDWRKNQPVNGGQGPGGRGNGPDFGRNDRRGDGRGAGGGQTRGDMPGGGPGFGRGGPGGPGGPGGTSGLVRAFLQERANQLETSGRRTDREEAAILRGLALRVEVNRGGFQGDMSAALLDTQGHALLLTGLLREAHVAPADTMKVTLPDGTSGKATFVGSNLYSNYTVVKLDNFKGVTPVKWATVRLAPYKLLMATTAGSGVSTLLVAAGKPGEPFAVDHMIIPAEDRAGVFLFNSAGELAAVSSSGGGFGERNATGAVRMQREVEFIIGEKRDIEPRPLGLGFETIAATATSPRTVKVSYLFPRSLAEAAGLKKGDFLVSIDNRPIAELVSGDNKETPGMIQLKVDLVTRTTPVPLVVNRDNKEINLTMPLK